MWNLQAENLPRISLAHRQRILPLDFLLCFSILEVYSVWQPLCTYMAPRHSDFGTSEIHIPYLSFRHPWGAGLSGESGKGKHFEGRLKTGLGKTSLTRQLLIIHDANNFSLLAKTRDPLCSFPYHHHLGIRNSANQFLGFLEKREKEKKKKEERKKLAFKLTVLSSKSWTSSDHLLHLHSLSGMEFPNIPRSFWHLFLCSSYKSPAGHRTL